MQLSTFPHIDTLTKIKFINALLALDNNIS